MILVLLFDTLPIAAKYPKCLSYYPDSYRDALLMPHRLASITDSYPLRLMISLILVYTIHSVSHYPVGYGSLTEALLLQVMIPHHYFVHKSRLQQSHAQHVLKQILIKLYCRLDFSVSIGLV